MEKYLNPALSPEERAEDLLSKMTLEEKMAQVVGIFGMPPKQIPPERLAMISKLMPNGIGQVSALMVRTLPNVHDALAMQRDLQKIIMESSPHHIPAIFHMEGVCGTMLTGSTSFSSNLGRGATFDPELEEEVGRVVARQELAAGVTQILCPVLDVNREPRMGRVTESYSEDPTLAAAMGTAMAKGLQGTKVGELKADACAKHFMGFHSSEGGVHGSASFAGDRVMMEIYGKPFQAAIAKADIKAVMPCYNTFDGEPASASKKLLTDILRDQMGFTGAAISDYGAVSNIHEIQHVGETLAEGGYLSLQAGMDCELPMPKALTKDLEEMFRDGRADVAVLDQAVLRELTAKFRMGLFEQPFALSDEDFDKVFNQPHDTEVTLRVARESLILLKNDGVLPLRKGLKKIALIGPHAAWANHYFGGYTHLTMAEGMRAAKSSMAGVMGNAQQKEINYIPGTIVEFSETEKFGDVLKYVKPGCQTILEKLREDLPETEIVYAHGYHVAGSDESGFAEALEACKDADLILLTLGGKHGTSSIATMGEGIDATNINLPAAQDRFIEEAAKLGIPMVGIHIDGRPISSDIADEKLSAILECFSPAECTAKVVSEVLRGETNPSGKMPITTARNAGQVPVYYNHLPGSEWHQSPSIGFQNYVDCPHEPRYRFGHGLSYTTFEYSDLVIGSETVDPSGSVTIACTVKNTGAVKGCETVQLYLNDPYASMTRPVQELQGFKRVDLEPGEAKTVTFTLYPSQMAFLTQDMKWKIEKGQVNVMVGSSSADIRLTGSYRIAEDKFIEGRTREFWADAEVK